ncbi:tail tubular protein A [Rhizobium phage RHph_I40]|uniref:Tail tubular protein A n=1 Tax=Rhizobium phage RHph_I38 TaxID=2509734 RepID=A0A7S5R8T3_9CAUD|nr:tail tubular protein A [Rhizobium phage RHph_I38]QXV73667.1 tail tubular protein A [Rhizobium phage RHph_I40]
MFSELEIINHILRTLGESITPTLETQHPAVQQALDTMRACSKEMQSRGWWFNKEYNMKLLPDTDGRIRLPDETLSFAVTKCVLEGRMPLQKQRFVKRGQYIYDMNEHTNKINTAIWADIVLHIPIEDLPATAGAYLKHWAAETAYLPDDGDTTVYRLIQQETAKSYALLMADELKSVSANALESPHALNLRMGVNGYGGYSRNPMYPGGGRY